MAGTAAVSSLQKEFTSMVGKYFLEEVSLVISFRKNLDSLCDELESINLLLKDAGGKRNSHLVCNWLENLEDFLDDAVDIVEESQAGGNLRNPIFRFKMGRKIKKLNYRMTKIMLRAKYIKYVGSLFDVNDRLKSQSQDKRERSNASVDPVGIEIDIQKITELVLKEEDPQVIAVVGMGGQGKTLLVQSIFKSQRVKQLFERQFWLVVSQKLDAWNVLNQMGTDEKDLNKVSREMKLQDLPAEMVKKFFADLKGKRCLFVFDDVWEEDRLLQLREKIVMPIESRHKIVITTRLKKVAEVLRHPTHIHEMKNLCEEDSWKLFCIHAFPDNGHSVPEGLTEDMCKPICKKCSGLPLAIKTIGAYMATVRRLPNDWQETFTRLNTLHGISDTVMPSLRLSYEVLPDDLKSCFLYLSVFPKGVEIECENLVHMWIAQGFFPSQVDEAEHAYDAGRLYIEELIDRCLVQVSQVGGDDRVKRCKIHDLFIDLAVSDCLTQTKCFLKPREGLKILPAENCVGLRRISLIENDISQIKEAIRCPGLRILLLSQNLSLTSISAKNFNNLPCLTVLDLSYTAITSLPKSIGNLKRLKFLNVSRTDISELPESLSGLRRLQFLDVSHCSYLSKLHSGIGKHKSMQYLNVQSCGKLEFLPRGISELSHLQTLKGSLSNARAETKSSLQLRDLKGLNLLRHLSLHIDHEELEERIFGSMKKMVTLSLINNCSKPLHLANDMGVMERLETVRLRNWVVPKWMFTLENLMELDLALDHCDNYKGLEKTPNLKKLYLSDNNNCVEFPKEFGESTAFPKLEEFSIYKFDLLEKFPPLHVTAMPMLKYFGLKWCSNLTNMVEGIENLKSLEEVEFLTQTTEDLWSGKWLHILKAREIKITVTPSHQGAIDKIVSKDIPIDGI